MIEVRPIIFVIGLLLCVLATAMLLPAAIDIYDGNDDWRTFVGAAMMTLFFGGIFLAISDQQRDGSLDLRQTFLLTVASWLILPAFAATPFVGLGLDYTDAFFEAMSGVTTTGATILTQLDGLPRGVLLWRSILQWIGGVGIIMMAIILLPFLRVGGMQLFQTESSAQSEKVLSRSYDLVVFITWIYLGLTLACALIYFLFGMSGFDAFCHAMTTVSTAGFSTHDDSLGFFKSPAIEWTATFFMLAGALPFVLYFHLLRGRFVSIREDPQALTFLAFISGTTLLVTLWLTEVQDRNLMESLRDSMFHVVSVVTGTGYAVEDYGAWGVGALGFFLLLTFIGGCAGSTTGGIKIYRFQVAWIIGRTHLINLLSPHRVVVPTYNGRRLPEDVPFSVLAFLAIYLVSVGMVTLALTGIGLDFVTAISSSATAISNVGPGLGPIVGPKGTFATLPGSAKWIMSFAMMLGRLELFTVIVVLRPEFWRS